MAYVTPAAQAEADQLIAAHGLEGFRAFLEEWTGHDLALSPPRTLVVILDAHRRGKLKPPGFADRAMEVYRRAPGPTPDDTGFSDHDGNPVSKEVWEVLVARGRAEGPWPDWNEPDHLSEQNS